jgi:dienelactone hydrolase
VGRAMTRLLALLLMIIALAAPLRAQLPAEVRADADLLRTIDKIALEMLSGRFEGLKAAWKATGDNTGEANPEVVCGRLKADVGRIRRVRAAMFLSEDEDTRTVVVPVVGEIATLDLRFVLLGKDSGKDAGAIIAVSSGPHEEPDDRVYEREANTHFVAPYVDESLIRRRALEMTTAVPSLPVVYTHPRTATRKERVPVAIIIPPPGPVSIEGPLGHAPIWQDIADGLACNGIAVLRYESREYTRFDAVRKAGKNFDDSDVADAISAINLALAQPESDDTEVFLIGFSVGSLTALRVAAKDPRIKGLVLLAPPAHYDAKRALLVREAEASSGAIESAIIVRDRIDAARISGNSALASDRFLDRGSSWWNDVRDMSPLDYAESFSGPLFFSFAENDEFTTTEDIDAWKARFSKRANLIVRYYIGANEMFVRPVTGTYSPDHVMPELLRDMLAFMLRGSTAPTRVTSPERAPRRAP